MSFHRKTLIAGLALASLFISTHAVSSQMPPTIGQGKQFVILQTPVSAAPKVIEFFSFYCRPCEQFVTKYPVAEAINNLLPDGEKVTKYHVSAMGPLGHELTEAWSVAMLLGKTEAIEKKLFAAIRGRKIREADDIKMLFASVGIDAETFENARKSAIVRNTTAQQNAAIKTFSVTATPAFYVAGKYRINNAGITGTGADEYATNFARVVKILLDTQP